MTFGCNLPKPDYKKCIPFYIVGAVLLVVGIPLMIAGIVGGFNFSDFIGYVGGVCTFFGILFFFVWYVITIPNQDKMEISSDETETLGATKDKVIKTKVGEAEGFSNLAYVTEDASRQHLTSPTRHKSTTSCSSDSISEFKLTKKQSNNSNNVAAWEREILERGRSSTDSQADISCISGSKISYHDFDLLT